MMQGGRDSNCPDIQIEPFGASGFLLIAGFFVIVRLVFAGLLDLFPAEAYYWSYAQHLDIGYLDHPPMVAWLIWISTFLGGQSEFFVRLPAFICWIVFAVFMIRFARRMLGKAVISPTLLLTAMLPIYFSLGFLMTPDAPFYACWAGALYFLERALVQKHGRAWLWAGVCVGLGLLSKYTMALIVGSAFIFMVIDADSRRWFRRPEPYLAVLVAALIFLPVIIWNYKNDWMSFAFQGSRRWNGASMFSLHELLGWALILLTPIGFLAAMAALVKPKDSGEESSGADTAHKRGRWFMLTFTLAPLSVFIIHSLRAQPRLNWIGPAWLAILPLIAGRFQHHRSEIESRFRRFIRWGWKPTIVALVIIYPLGFLYIYLGAPGYTPPRGLPLPTAWGEFADKVELIEDSLENTWTGDPLVVGLDDYRIVSELSYYGRGEGDSLPEHGGSALVGGGSLMWTEWLPASEAAGRNIILISFKESPLDRARVTEHFDMLTDIRREQVEKHGRAVGHFFWRLGVNYH